MEFTPIINLIHVIIPTCKNKEYLLELIVGPVLLCGMRLNVDSKYTG